MSDGAGAIDAMSSTRNSTRTRRFSRKKRLRLLPLLVVLGLLLSACTGGDDTAVDEEPGADGQTTGDEQTGDGEETDTADGGGEGDPLRIVVSTEIASLDPQKNSDTSHLIVFGNMFNALVAREPGGEIVPSLAESWEAVDDSTWRFELRDDVTFHNGEPFNAESAAYSINRIIDPEYETLATSAITDIADAEAVDEYTLEINTDGSVATLLGQLVYIFMVPQEASQTEDFAENPVGTGPYQLENWDREQQISMTAFGDYWGEAPEIQNVVVRTIADRQAALAAVQAGEVDIVPGILPEQAELVPQAISLPGVEFSNIQLNRIGVEELNDPRVAMALQLAIDTQAVADSLYAGYARPSPGGQHLDDRMVGFNPDLEDYPFDPERARELLEEAGYPDGFSITLHGAFARYLKGVESVELVASYWTDIGLDVEVQLHEFNTYREIGRIPGDESGALDTRYNWNDSAEFDSSGYYNHVVCGESSSKYCNDDVTQLFGEAQGAIDVDVRDQAWQEAWAILHDDISHIRLLQHDKLFGASERVNWDGRADEFIPATEISLG